MQWQTLHNNSNRKWWVLTRLVERAWRFAAQAACPAVCLAVCLLLLAACRKPASTPPPTPEAPLKETVGLLPTQTLEGLVASEDSPERAEAKPVQVFLPLVSGGGGSSSQQVFLPLLFKDALELVEAETTALQRIFLPLLESLLSQVVPEAAGETRFKVEDFETQRPPDVRQEVFFSGSGADGAPYCEPVDQPSRLSGYMSRVDWLGRFEWATCGWQAGEFVEVTTTLPDGSQIKEYYQARQYRDPPDGDIEYSYRVRREDPVGWYQVEAVGKAGQAQTSFYVADPQAPRMYLFPGGELLLKGFAPGEKVRLFIYGASDYLTSTFMGYRHLQVSAQGELEYDPLIAGSYIAVGEQSGEVHTWKVSDDPLVSWMPLHGDITQLDCAARNPYPAEWVAGSLVRNYSDVSAGVYNTPDLANGVLLKMEVGDNLPFKLVSNPVCTDDRYWWKVELADGQQGWTFGADWAPVPVPDAACPLPGHSRLAVGRLARVAPTASEGAWLYSTAGSLEQSRLALLPVGTYLYVLEGPACASGQIWWKVVTEDNVTGWLAEGDASYYYVEPVR